MTKRKKPLHIDPKDWKSVDSPVLNDGALQALRPTDEIFPELAKQAARKRGQRGAHTRMAAAPDTEEMKRQEVGKTLQAKLSALPAPRRKKIKARAAELISEQIHPGMQLQNELDEVSMTAAALASQIDVPANRISQILKGKREITADTALRLGHFFGTSAQFWMNLQSLYELRIAQDGNGSAIEGLPTLKEVHAHALPT